MLATLIRLAIGVGHLRKVCWLLSSRNSILLRGVFFNESRMRKGRFNEEIVIEFVVSIVCCS